MPGPLHGFRVLDITTMVSGPVATMMLADQGADVIKIEPPGGELMRRVGVERRGMTASFLSCNRGKRSLAIDLKSAEGASIALRLAATADVLVQNYRPGAIDRMGFGERKAAVRAVRPDIVFVSISGFGESGPYAHKRVYDPVIQALSGLADIQSDRATGEPRMVRHHRSRQDDIGHRGAGDHRGAARARTQRRGPACAPVDARHDDRLSVARWACRRCPG